MKAKEKIFGSMTGPLTALLLFPLCCPHSYCQESDPAKEWTLKDVVEYAIANSVSVKSKEVEEQNSEISLQTSRLSRLPSLSGQIGENLNFGRSQNREGVTEDQSSANTSLGAGMSIPVFEGFRINRQIKADKFNLEASRLETQQLRQDLTLNVVGLFLNVLYSTEALNISRQQVQINKKLVSDTEIMVENGRKSASELYNAQASLAGSESFLVEAENNCRSSMLDLVQAINYPDYRGFRIQAPGDDALVDDAYLRLSPVDSICESYLARRPSIQAAEYRVKAAQSGVKLAQSRYWPSIQLGVSYGTGYYSNSQYQAASPSFFSQLGNNGQVAVGATLSIPIFNRMTTYNSVRTAKNMVTLQTLALQQNRLDAIKQVQNAYVNASTAKGKYEAGKKSVEAARKAFEFEQKKYESGMSTSYQFEQSRQKYAEAVLSQLQTKYTFIFRSKILDFYKGNPLY